MRLTFSRDRVVGICVIVLAICVGVYSFTQIPEPKIADDVGSRAFPLLCSGTMLVCGVILVVRKKETEYKRFLLPAQWKRLGGILGLYLLYYLALNFLGFLISTPVFVFVLCTLLANAAKKEVGLVKRIVFSLVVTALVFCLFQLILNVTLPKGIFK